MYIYPIPFQITLKHKTLAPLIFHKPLIDHRWDLKKYQYRSYDVSLHMQVNMQGA